MPWIEGKPKVIFPLINHQGTNFWKQFDLILVEQVLLVILSEHSWYLSAGSVFVRKQECLLLFFTVLFFVWVVHAKAQEELPLHFSVYLQVVPSQWRWEVVDRHRILQVCACTRWECCGMCACLPQKIGGLSFRRHPEKFPRCLPKLHWDLPCAITGENIAFLLPPRSSPAMFSAM